MKKFLWITAVATLTFISCQKEDDLVNTNSPTSMIDPDTPKDVRPYFVNESISNGRTQGVPSTIYDASLYQLKLAYSDEFNNGTTLDATKWTKEDSGVATKGLDKRDPALTWWGTRPEYVSVNNGYLKLSSYKASPSSLFCGSIESNNKIETRYGYFEALIDIQSPGSTGTQTAFWLMGDAMKAQNTTGPIVGSGADGAEIDIFESSWLNDVVHTTIHCDGYVTGIKFGDGKAWTATGFETGYHYFGLLWRADKLAIFYDGQLEIESGTTSTPVHWGDAKYIPLVPEFIKLSVGAAFGNANTGFSSRAVGTTYTSLIDWVHVYQIP